jgi:hypothetical protein
MSGSGWSCNVTTLVCTRSDSLAQGQSYPPIYLTGNVLSSAPAQFLNELTVYGGGSNTGAASYTIPVGQASQSITFGSLVYQLLGAAPFTVGATASSGLAVSFTSTTSAACTVSGTTVTLLDTVGTCTIQATQTGDTEYAAATPVSQSFPVLQYSPCDLKENGTISVADVQLIINEALGVAPAVNDLAATGVVNVVDVQIEINAALGLGCAAK